MPLYDYRCDTCGDFRDWQPMDRSQDPAGCPTCGDPADRRVAMPFIAALPAHTRIAHARNEKSAHEPRLMSRSELNAHGGHLGHGHCHGHSHGQGVPLARGLEPGLKRSPKQWMVGH